ncbi:MAG TPA: hypothetical protein PK402_14025, partial [Tepidisphaeraceae bacterium]|nr:hypothetical protein [Tepidisphaeraceae bacterium]
MSSNFIANEIYTAFDARRVKTPELKNVDIWVNGIVGWVKNRKPRLPYYRRRAKLIEALEPEIQLLTDGQLKEEVEKLKQEARLGNMDLKHFAGTKKKRTTDLKQAEVLMNRAFAIVREAAKRSLGKRPYLVQLMGAMAMVDGYVIEMATGEGKTLTAALAASVMAWSGRPVHVITVNDYLVARDAAWNKPLFDRVGVSVGHVVHETSSQERLTAYRSGVVYITSKELVADFLRDQIMTGALRSSTQTVVGMMLSQGIRSRLLVPGLFRAIADEADSLLIDEAVTPLIISNSPNDEANAERYKRADTLARQLVSGRDFTIDKTVRSVDLTQRGQDKLEELAAADTGGFWAGKRRREELVTQALVGRYCFHLDEH